MTKYRIGREFLKFSVRHVFAMYTDYIYCRERLIIIYFIAIKANYSNSKVSFRDTTPFEFSNKKKKTLALIVNQFILIILEFVLRHFPDEICVKIMKLSVQFVLESVGAGETYLVQYLLLNLQKPRLRVLQKRRSILSTNVSVIPMVFNRSGTVEHFGLLGNCEVFDTDGEKRINQEKNGKD